MREGRREEWRGGREVDWRCSSVQSAFLIHARPQCWSQILQKFPLGLFEVEHLDQQQSTSADHIKSWVQSPVADRQTIRETNRYTHTPLTPL